MKILNDWLSCNKTEKFNVPAALIGLFQLNCIIASFCNVSISGSIDNFRLGSFDFYYVLDIDILHYKNIIQHNS